MNIQIKHRYTDAVLFECEAPDGMDSGLHTRHALEKAASAGANLAGANLAGANLAGANLAGANLAGANLDGANLDGANLDGGVALLGDRPVFQIGPIGSRCAMFTAYITSGGLRLRAGCFFGSVDEFESALTAEHKGGDHETEYTAALVLIRAHAEIWTPKEK